MHYFSNTYSSYCGLLVQLPLLYSLWLIFFFSYIGNIILMLIHFYIIFGLTPSHIWMIVHGLNFIVVSFFGIKMHIDWIVSDQH